MPPAGLPEDSSSLSALSVAACMSVQFIACGIDTRTSSLFGEWQGEALRSIPYPAGVYCEESVREPHTIASEGSYKLKNSIICQTSAELLSCLRVDARKHSRTQRGCR